MTMRKKSVELKVGDSIYQLLGEYLRERKIVRVTNKSYMLPERVDKRDVGVLPYGLVNRYYPTKQEAEEALRFDWRRQIENAKEKLRYYEKLLKKQKVRVHRY